MKNNLFNCITLLAWLCPGLLSAQKAELRKFEFSKSAYSIVHTVSTNGTAVIACVSTVDSSFMYSTEHIVRMDMDGTVEWAKQYAEIAIEHVTHLKDGGCTAIFF